MNDLGRSVHGLISKHDSDFTQSLGDKIPERETSLVPRAVLCGRGFRFASAVWQSRFTGKE